MRVRGMSWGMIVTVAMGFVIGFVLAGIGGISAGLQASQTESKLEINKIEEYWATTDLQESDLRKLVNNKSCNLSEKYFLACVNSVISALSVTSERLSFSGEILPFYSETNSLDNFNEKANLIPFSKIFKENLQSSFSFDQLWDKILAKANSKTPLRYLLAQGINGYLSVSKDPHTYILPMDYFDQVSSVSERSPYFVGLNLDKTQGRIRIKKVVYNSDAQHAGLEVNDVILSLNGKKAEDLNLADAAQILKDRNSRILTFVISRKNINGESATLIKNVQRSYRVLSQVYSEVIQGARNLGVISISKFSKNTCQEVQEAIFKMADKNISGLILDLRDNPGGHLSEAACLSGLFIGENKRIYSIQYFDVSKSNEVVLTSSERIYSGPLAIIVNTNSASASELFAGAMQEYHRAIIVGSKTFGKGTFQEIDSWADSKKVGFFKTKGFYLLPSGHSTQFYGVMPDIEAADPKVLISSEEINYMNPIRPMKIEHANQKANFPLQRCTNQKMDNMTDSVLAEAVNHLNCNELMSFVALQYSSSEFSAQ